MHKPLSSTARQPQFYSAVKKPSIANLHANNIWWRSFPLNTTTLNARAWNPSLWPKLCAWSLFKTLTVEWWSMWLILLIKWRYVTEQRPYRAHTRRTKEALTNLWARQHCRSVYCLRKSSLHKNDDVEGQKQLPGQKRCDKRHLPLGWNLLRWGISEGLFPLISGSFCCLFPHGLTLIPSLICSLFDSLHCGCDCYPLD